MAACSYADDPPADRKIASVVRSASKSDVASEMARIKVTKPKSSVNLPPGFKFKNAPDHKKYCSHQGKMVQGKNKNTKLGSKRCRKK